MNQLKLIITIIFISSLHSLAYSQNDSIVAITELQRMNDTFGYRIRMNITKEGTIVSLPNQEIQLSIAELKRLSQVTRKDIRLYIVRFIVAHEFAHQIQYYKYANDPRFMNNDLVSKTLLETQADIMAGLIFLQLSPEIMQYQKTHLELVDSIFNELFKVTYSMGIRENTLGSHPSKRDRMLAVRLGLTYGLNFVYDQWVMADSDRAIQYGITPQLFKNTKDEQFRFIDLKNGEDLISWSYRQAKKIVNYDRKIATGILLLTPSNERFVFHTEISNPYVDYKLTYKNISPKSIDMEMEVFVALVGREDPNTPEHYRKINVNHYKFTLLPGQSKTITDKLLWIKNGNDTLGNFEMVDNEMPRIVYPGGKTDDNIFSCSYSNDTSNIVYQENITSLNLQGSTKSLGFQAFFNELLNHWQTNDENIIKGIGEVNINYPDEITYTSSLQFDDEVQTFITIDSNRHITSIELLFTNFYPYTDKMFAKYNEIKKQINMEVDDCIVEEGKIGENFWTTYSSDDFTLFLETLKYDKAEDETKLSSVRLQLFFE